MGGAISWIERNKASMVISRTTFAFMFGIVLCSTSPVTSAKADAIVSETSGTLSGSLFYGQSFTTPSGGPWDDITFNFFSNIPATTPEAVGTAYLLSESFSGSPSDLDSAVPGFLASSTSIVDGEYEFNPLLTLSPDTTYFLYVDTQFTSSVSGGVSGYGGGNGYFSTGASSAFAQTGEASLNFNVSGVQAAPEPSTFLPLLTGLGLLAFEWRRKGRC